MIKWLGASEADSAAASLRGLLENALFEVNVGLDQQIPHFLLLIEGALAEFGQSAGVGDVAEAFEQAVKLDYLVGRKGVEELLCDVEAQVAELGGLEVSVLRELFPLQHRVTHLVVDRDGLSFLLLEHLLVLDVEHLLVLLGDVLEHFEEHYEVEFDLYFGRVLAAQVQPVLVALEEVGVGVFEAAGLHADLGQEEVVPVNALVVDLYVLVDLDGVFGVCYGLLVLRQLALAH